MKPHGCMHFRMGAVWANFIWSILFVFLPVYIFFKIVCYTFWIKKENRVLGCYKEWEARCPPPKPRDLNSTLLSNETQPINQSGRNPKLALLPDNSNEGQDA
jgi:hypothetical protein